MPRGGKRPGAGRKQGAATKRTRAIADQMAQTGLMPLDYMLEVVRDSGADERRRDDLAKAAAPYIHPRLSSVEQKKPPLDLSKLTDAELEQLRDIYRRAGDRSNGSDGDEAAAMSDNAVRKSPGTRH